MSRSRFPPTPSMSGELIIKDKTIVDGTDVFALPPAALSPSKMEAASRRNSKSEHSAFFPASPTSPRMDPTRNVNPPPQAGLKRPLEDLDLPPPPTRTRKIIQMKPKTQTADKPAAAAASSKTPAKGNTKAAGAANSAAPASAAGSKKKQPSATSAAGRKIARKTAHSLIERRRRSKMNEEFSTLKNMIPACRGQEMHKLAILQASIDYVNYLEKCITDLKTPGEHKLAAPPSLPAAPLSPTSPEFLADTQGSTYSASVSPEVPPESIPSTSPMYSPRSRIPSTAMSEIPPTILPSPALGPVRTNDRSMGGSMRSSWALPQSLTTSPALQPRFSNASSADVDHEASAALLMLNRDPRGSIDSARGGSAGSSSGSGQGSASTAVTSAATSVSRDDERHKHPEPQRKRMSVMDLLIS
ncbi:basic helix-loop-helix domain-containing protein [Aspergillus stella-maris]|uniref:basic helix-loop-helix domain-containing protein n=1 Tax=Aspergillus stella-maris TaxID=1810926 RepID=UPI003CCD7924